MHKTRAVLCKSGWAPQCVTAAEAMCICRQIESMAASAAAQQAGHAEAEQRLIERLQTVEAALSEARESEHSLGVCLLQEPLHIQ